MSELEAQKREFTALLDELIADYCDGPGASYEDIADFLDDKAAALRRECKRND